MSGYVVSNRYRMASIVSVLVIAIMLAVMILMIGKLFEIFGLFAFIFLALPLISLLAVILYPKIKRGRVVNEIENNIHFYITHLGALATSEVDRKEMMNIIHRRAEYGALAEETRKIYILMTKWGKNLAQACKFVARRTPSKIFADFLDRMAHELDSGEDLKEFIKREQDVVMSAYTTLYQSKLYSIDIFKEIYVSLIISLSFFAAFGIILPFLTGTPITTILSAVVLIFIMIDLGIMAYLKAIAPSDPIWQQSGKKSDIDLKILRLLALAALISAATIVVLYVLTFFQVGIPLQFAVCTAATPLIIPGLYARREEKLIMDRDRNAPSFLMSLGASASARGGNILQSLKYLTAHDFGILTKNVKALYKRLNTRINKLKAWEKFAIETGSNLIYRFIRMFVEAINLGSDPKDVAEIISKNFITINNLRMRRAQTASSFVGIAYGVTVGIAFSLYISFGVVQTMNSLYASFEQTAIESIGSILHTVPVESLGIVRILIFIVLAAHALISSFAIKIADGGRWVSGMVHFVGMLWASAGMGYASELVMKYLLNIQSFGS
ncbi:MAG: type II secretion protein F [Thermoprotei archaeon]|nr:MAG: type II secretion protein F [Thermoprotei archaeon]